MKKSNKLLFGGFLLLLLLITAVHLSLYAKYKAGHFTILNDEKDLLSETTQLFPNILYVSIENISGATIKFSDVARLEKTQKKDIQYVQKGNTLFISSTDSTNIANHRHPLEFYLPYRAQLSVKNSSLYFLGGKKRIGDTTVMDIRKSVAIFPGEDDRLSLGLLKVSASENSLVLFQGKAHVDHLDVQLSDSGLDSKDGDFSRLSVSTDSLSRITMTAKQLLKAEIKTSTQ